MDARFSVIVILVISVLVCVFLHFYLVRFDRKGDELSRKSVETGSRLDDLESYELELVELRGKLQEQIASGLPNMQLSEECQQVYEEKLTGYPVLDTLLKYKASLADSKGIRMEYRGAALPDDLMSDSELVSLFGNLIDNALEAVERIDSAQPGDDPLDVLLEWKKFRGQWTLAVENRKPENDRPKERDFVTSKRDKANHGFGTRIIRRIVKAHGGMVRSSDLGGHFRVLVVIPLGGGQ